MELKVNAQGETPILIINPGATDSDSQNPIAPRNIIIPVGTMVIWLKRLHHQIVSGTPDKGPSNIFYGEFFVKVIVTMSHLTIQEYSTTMIQHGLISTGRQQ